MGSFSIGLDGLSAFFLLPILVLSALAAVYGGAYLQAHHHKGGGHDVSHATRDGSAFFHPGESEDGEREQGQGARERSENRGPATGNLIRKPGASWFFYNLLVASMIMVIMARNGVLFLIAWEVMAIASYFLVMYEDESALVRKAGSTYLIATHCGTAFLLALFILLGRQSGSLDFSTFEASGLSGVAFLMALVGFGTKAGLVPLHVWLPEAHPAAPSHVSAVMSGVMIKTGIYGLIRTLTFLGPPPPWWGWTLIGIGAISGILGVLFALAQHDLKRLLAYHSVENIGIITLGLGLGLLGVSYDQPLIAVLGFAGGLLHVVNHALFKGLLFLGAGAVAHAAQTREIDRLGGLLRRMPWTGAAFLIGSVAICGLPPLNGFVSEFLIYVGAFEATSSLMGPTAVSGMLIVGALALIGGLATACFTKAFGIVFLGEPRTDDAARAVEVTAGMRIPLMVLAACCAAIGLLAPLAFTITTRSFPSLANLLPYDAPVLIHQAAGMMRVVVLCLSSFLLLLSMLFIIRHKLLSGRSVEKTVTWDCGYAAPTSRMQYTASSYAQPLTQLFHFILRTHRDFSPPQGFFPESAALSTHTQDAFEEEVYRPLFQGVGRLLSRLRWLQSGRIQLYVLYIALTLLILLMWKLG